MDAFWTTLLGKALTECGLLNLFTLISLGAVCLQNVKSRTDREKERQEVEKSRQSERDKFLEMVEDSNVTIRDLSVAVETMKGTLAMLGFRGK